MTFSFFLLFSAWIVGILKNLDILKMMNYIKPSYIMLLSVKSHWQLLSFGFNRLLKSGVKSKKKSILHVFLQFFLRKSLKIWMSSSDSVQHWQFRTHRTKKIILHEIRLRSIVQSYKIRIFLPHIYFRIFAFFCSSTTFGESL